MPENVVTGAMITCNMAIPPTPMPLNAAVPPTMCNAGGPPAATIMHFAPFVNIPSFGMCNAPANPTVIAATAAALGVHTPGACIPATAAPWAPPATKVMIKGQPALLATAKCMCAYAGEISVVEPGQVSVQSM